MPKPLLLWVDCTSGMPDAEPRVCAASVFEVVHVHGAAAGAAELARARPQALCFDFDYPDQSCLRVMQTVKQTHPRLPILMLTLDHSEPLAVWAFRAHVWNYLVKPVNAAELLENLNALAALGHRAAPPRAAQALHAPIPDDLPVRPVPANVARLQPALRYATRNYHQRVTASAAARACGLSRFEFSRKFRGAFGCTFREHLMRVRIAEARRMLAEGRVSITGVAYSVGFNDGSHFARMFRRYAGVLPSAYLNPGDGDVAAAGTEASPADVGLRRRATDALEAEPV